MANALTRLTGTLAPADLMARLYPDIRPITAMAVRLKDGALRKATLPTTPYGYKIKQYGRPLAVIRTPEALASFVEAVFQQGDHQLVFHPGSSLMTIGHAVPDLIADIELERASSIREPRSDLGQEAFEHLSAVIDCLSATRGGHARMRIEEWRRSSVRSPDIEDWA